MLSRAQRLGSIILAWAVCSWAPLSGAAEIADARAGAAATAAAEKQAKEAFAKRVNGAYKPVFYDNDFSYLDNPNYDQWFPGDRFKQLPLGDCWIVDFGGQYRARYQDEQNIRGLGLTGRDDDFLLQRTRIFANVRYSDWFRFYGEFLDAESNGERFVPRGIEVNRAEMLNLFVDARIMALDAGDLWCRLGRQELLYGSERLISPLDWANTRRTFEGAKFFWQSPDWNVDVFATRPVFPAEGFDTPDRDKEFYGAWATNKAVPNQTTDFYALQYNDSLPPSHFRFTTIGGRRLNSFDNGWLFETEGGVQFGENSNGSGHGAGFMTGGLGRKWDDATWKPQIMCYYDWASGGNLRGAGQGFNHLFPLAHKYLGFMDLFGRSNIESPNCQVTMQLTPKLKMLTWYYYLFLENKRDTPYNVNMTPFNPANAPGSAELGHEIDLLWTYALNPRMELGLGYSHFFTGRYYRTTPGVPTDADGDFLYAYYQWNF